MVEGRHLRLEHVLFRPDVSRPVRLALVHLENRGDEPLIVDYTETWDLARDGYRVAEAAAVAETRDGLRALADASVAPRARPPRQTPAVGLAPDEGFIGCVMVLSRSPGRFLPPFLLSCLGAS